MFIAIELFKEIIQGVNYLHSHVPLISHLDLKPNNILIKVSEPLNTVCKISDFGLLSKPYVKTNSTHCGSSAYRAPDGLFYGIKADIYSLGVVLNNMFDPYLSSDDSTNSTLQPITPLPEFCNQLNNLKKLKSTMTHVC
ncbi:testis-specific serine/threonine-protein kinase 6-like [Oppia nitens]|uniref:testis-specific serine/threonine-protein kinase 6-like n=1 Tax=Oppia nitens TaxID=1686743 RepID=UPI0023D9ED37|nr:testis-specific serine/threonine-protein kinase 6-like [Oppia nitens]